MFRPANLIKFGAVVSMSAKNRDGIEEIKTRVRSLLDLYADLKLEQSGVKGDAADRISKQLREHFPAQVW